MRYSNLFTKTKKHAPKDEVSKNAQLLLKAGFIHKEMAGVYAYLPLGLRVVKKITEIIREEMNAIGSLEFSMTSLQPKENWTQTDRWDDNKVDVWFKSKLKNDSEVGLAWSHEEPITLMMKEHIQSYRDLPVYVYQFQTKLRNEIRAKSGILRTREFIMKDLYSYSRNPKEHEEFYQRVIQAYLTIFDRVGIGDQTYFTFASGGAFTQFSHEFQTICEAGEDIAYIDFKKKMAINKEVYTDDVVQQLGLQKKSLVETKVAEVGNIFNFGTSKSEQLGLYFTNEEGTKAPVVLGSYGIGIGRLMGVLVEIFSDEAGIMWPKAVAPFQVHLVGIGLDDDTVGSHAESVYERLIQADIEVLFDDRIDVGAGAKLADADLIGCPVRLVVSKRTGKHVEFKLRTQNDSLQMTVDEAIQKI